MKFRSTKKKTIVLLVISLLLVISIGYAFLTSNLEINGFSKIFNSSWNIHFNNVQYADNNVTLGVNDQAATINPNDDKEVTYTVSFKEPGEKYEFTVDVVNDGTIDGMVSLITSKIKVGDDEYTDITPSSLPSYLNYSVTYGDGAPIEVKHKLKAGDTETYKVKVEFKKDVNEEDLPDENTPVEFELKPTYEQIDDTAEERTPYINCTYNGELTPGVEYVEGQFTYRYMQQNTTSGWSDMNEDGWGVALTDIDSTDPVDTVMCNMINNKPVVSASSMFSNTKTTSINTQKLNTATIKNMGGMFSGATELTELDVSNFDTRNVSEMNGMFANVSKVTELDVSNFDISNLSHLTAFMFGTTNLVSANFDNWDFNNGQYLIGQNIFTNSGIKEFSAKNWKTPEYFTNLITLWDMDTIETMDFTGLDLSRTHYINNLFNSGTAAKQITGLDTWNISGIEDMSYMFQGCSNLEKVDLRNWNTRSLTNTSWMFSNCLKLNSVLGINEWNTENLTNITGMFYTCPELTEIDLSNWDTSKVTSMDSFLTNSIKLETANLNNWNLRGLTTRYGAATFFDNSGLKKLYARNWKLPSDFSYFNNTWYTRNLEFIDITNWDLSITDNISYLFYGASRLKKIVGLHTLDTSRITNMTSMFEDCNRIENLDLSNFDTSNVTSMISMFEDCNLLKEIDLSSFNTSELVNMSSMFEDCLSLTTIYVSSEFVTDKITSAGSMFLDAYKLIGGMGTAYSQSVLSNPLSYAHIDEGETNPGLFTAVTGNVVTFNPNGGYINITKKYVNQGEKVGELPIPEKDNYVFVGWYSEPNSGIEIDNNTIINNNVTYYARWQTPIVVTFDANGGKPDITHKNYVGGRKLEDLPIPTKENSAFKGWYTDISNGIKVDEDTIINNDITYYARWDNELLISEMSWENIISTIRNGEGYRFKIGDEKEIDLGTFGTHNVRVANTTTPKECRKSDFSQTACGIVFEFTDILTLHEMNPTGTDYPNGTNIGSWKDSSMRTYVNNDIYNAIPNTIKDAIINTKVITGYGPNDGNENFVTTDKLYLISHGELIGDDEIISEDSAIKNSRQFDYYYKKYNRNSYSHQEHIKKNNGVDTNWWLRTPSSYNNYSFKMTTNSGSSSYKNSYSTEGVSPAFRIG